MLQAEKIFNNKFFSKIVINIIKQNKKILILYKHSIFDIYLAIKS